VKLQDIRYIISSGYLILYLERYLLHVAFAANVTSRLI